MYKRQVQVTLDDSFTRRLVKDHSDTGEIFLLLNNEQELIYSSADTLPFSLSELLPLPSSEQPAITLNNQSYYLDVYKRQHQYKIVHDGCSCHILLSILIIKAAKEYTILSEIGRAHV